MPSFSAWQGLPFTEQILHSMHFMLCAFAVLIALLPLLTQKGSPEHKFGGLIYVPVAGAALFLASLIAWREASLVLFCFNSFCAYLLFSGWRAVHEKEKPEIIDWIIPGALFALSMSVALYAVFFNEGLVSFYLLFFALNGVWLSHRDWRHLKSRTVAQKNKIFLVDVSFGKPPMQWLNRHITGMAGSALANFSVIVLTLLPASLHWMWSATLILGALYIAKRQAQHKNRLRKAFPALLRPKFAPKSPPRDDDEDWRRAA